MARHTSINARVDFRYEAHLGSIGGSVLTFVYNGMETTPKGLLELKKRIVEEIEMEEDNLDMKYLKIELVKRLNKEEREYYEHNPI